MHPPEPPQWLERITEYARQLADGDLTALGPLFDLVGPRLVRYAQALLRNVSDAEDAVQAAVVRLAKHPESSGGGANAVGLLSAGGAERIVAADGEAAADVDAFRTSHWPLRSAGGRIEEEEVRPTGANAVQRLPTEQAEVVVLKVWENLTFLEIAGVTGDRPNTVASRYRYALEKLQRSLESLAQEVCHAIRDADARVLEQFLRTMAPPATLTAIYRQRVVRSSLEARSRVVSWRRVEHVIAVLMAMSYALLLPSYCLMLSARSFAFPSVRFEVSEGGEFGGSGLEPHACRRGWL